MCLRKIVKPTQSQMSLVVSDIVLKNKFAIKRYKIVVYTCNILYLNEKMKIMTKSIRYSCVKHYAFCLHIDADSSGDEIT